MRNNKFAGRGPQNYDSLRTTPKQAQQNRQDQGRSDMWKWLGNAAGLAGTGLGAAIGGGFGGPAGMAAGASLGGSLGEMAGAGLSGYGDSLLDPQRKRELDKQALMQALQMSRGM